MTFADLVYQKIVPFIDLVLIRFLYAVAFISFLFGLYRLFFTGGEENRESGKQFAIWGIVGFVVLFGVWSIVRLLLGSLFAGV